MHPYINIFLFLGCSFFASAQKISVSDILATARKDAKYQSAQELSKFVQGMNYSLPLVQKLEVRYGADETSFLRNQYGVGLGFNPLAQRKAQFKYQSAQAQMLEAEGNLAFENALFERYNSIAQFAHLQRVIREQNKLDTLFFQKKTIMSEMLSRGVEVKIKDIIQNEAEQFELEKNILQNANNQQMAIQQISLFWGSPNPDIDLSQFITVNRIEQTIAALSEPVMQPSEVKLRESEIAFTQQKLKVERASNTQHLTNFQFGLQDDDKVTTWQNPYVRIGIRLPLFENNRLKYNNLALDIKAFQQKIEVATARQKVNVALGVQQLKQYFVTHKKQLDQQRSSLINSILKNEKINAEITAFEKIDLLIIEQKRQIEIAKSAFRITQDYITLLRESGAMTTMPLKNYLSE